MSKANYVIARYGNFFQGSDDYFTHCLILNTGDCWLLGQGLASVSLQVFEAPEKEFKELTAALATSIPAEWADASYNGYGYNFITDAFSPTATEIVVFGSKATPPSPLGHYYVPPPDSEVAKLVKGIAKIDPKP